MAGWDNLKNNIFTILRFIQLFPAWGIIISLFTYRDGVCLRWSRPGTSRESCLESANDTLAYYNWIGKYNVYPEIRGQLFVVCAAIFCALASFALLLSTIKCIRQERYRGGAVSVPLLSGRRNPMPENMPDFVGSTKAGSHSAFVKISLIVCILLMLAAGSLETWYALGFGRHKDIAAFVGKYWKLFGNWALAAVLCFVLAILYIIDFVLGMRRQRS